MAKKKNNENIFNENNEKHIIHVPSDITEEDFFKPNCKLCNSEYRKEAEEMYFKNNNAHAVYAFLQNKGEEISPKAVRNHLQNHFGFIERSQRLKEYAQDLSHWSQLWFSKKERMENYINILNRKIYLIESSVNNEDFESQKKSSEIVTKLMEQVNKCQQEIDRREESLAPIEIFLAKFRDLIKEKCSSSNDETKKILFEILDELSSLQIEISG